MRFKWIFILTIIMFGIGFCCQKRNTNPGEIKTGEYIKIQTIEDTTHIESVDTLVRIL